MLIVSKEISFDAAHMLTDHPGMCRNLHGHTYHVIVELANTPPLSGQPNDMVMDFKELKAVMAEEIESCCDHAYLYDTRSTIECDIAQTLQKYGMRTYPVPFRTTSENLAHHFFDKLKARGLPVSAISVKETASSCATFRA